MAIIWLLALFLTSSVGGREQLRRFPDDFQFGVATAAYQVEGGWNVGDKGESIWDRIVHQTPEAIVDHSTGDVACDSIRLYKRDIEMMLELGVDFYRFSISWPRLLPTGFADKISQDGLNYYNTLIDELLKHNITPIATIYHWDLPQRLQDIGGWPNPLIVDYYLDYARVVFEAFGDRVKTWITINEPPNICFNGYGQTYIEGGLAPGINFHGVADYLCGHSIIKAHAKAYHLYNTTYKATQKGRVGISLTAPWILPETESPKDKYAAQTMMQFMLGWFANPIFSTNGDYPKVMKDLVAKRSKEQKYTKSRLPVFTQEEIESIRGAYDFFGLNHYTSFITRYTDERDDENPIPSIPDDCGFPRFQNQTWPASAFEWLKAYPEGLRNQLNMIKNDYNNPEILITENGISTTPGLRDMVRVNYLNSYLEAVHQAITEDGVNVTHYTSWSLMDNMEWTDGYTQRFGLYEVDFDDANRTRTPRMSAHVYKEIVRTHVLDPLFMPQIVEKPKGPWPGFIPLIAILVVAVFVISFIIVLKKIGKERLVATLNIIKPSKESS